MRMTRTENAATGRSPAGSDAHTQRCDCSSSYIDCDGSYISELDGGADRAGCISCWRYAALRGAAAPSRWESSRMLRAAHRFAGIAALSCHQQYLPTLSRSFSGDVERSR